MTWSPVCAGWPATRRVGHAGTLDPMATGVLVLGLGRGTRLLGHLALADKEYLATIRLGLTTTTDDADGEVVSRRSAVGVPAADVAAAMAALTGSIEQVPSTVSAIKVGGRRAYARVRAGETVVLAPRRVRVDAFELLRAARGRGPRDGGRRRVPGGDRRGRPRRPGRLLDRDVRAGPGP